MPPHARHPNVLAVVAKLDAGENRVPPDAGGEADRLVARGLTGYVSAVAAALEVSVEATDSEVTDTATAYLGLAVRSAERPGRDLMLVWSERTGWALAVETRPAEEPEVLAYLGDDTVAEPAVVARFVSEALAGRGGAHQDNVPPLAARAVLAGRLAPYAKPRR